MEETMQGKVVLVTGGSSGIGQDTAVAFARKGARVAVTDVVPKDCEEIMQQLGALQPECAFVQADVSKPEDMERAVAEVVKRFGRLDYAVNNAGIGGASNPVAEYGIDDWNKVISINLSGVFYSMKYEIQQMVKQGQGGAIVNVASILGLVGFANSAAYVSAKHGVVGLTETAALEYSKMGIRVNAVCPGFIATPLLEKAGITDQTDAGKWIIGLHPIGRLGKGMEIANAVVWLCSDEASFVCGEAFRVDGGYISQ